MIRLLICLLPLVAMSCSCPPQPDLKRYGEWDFKTPEACLEYFRLALMRREAYHIKLCLSEEALRADDVRLDVLHTYIQEVIDKLESMVGKIEDVEIDDATYRPGRPWLADVRVSGRDRSETVYCILQTTAWVTFTDGRDGRTIEFTEADTLKEAVAKEAVLTSKGVYRVEYEKGWRILGVSNSDIGAEMNEFMRDLDKK